MLEENMNMGAFTYELELFPDVFFCYLSSPIRTCAKHCSLLLMKVSNFNSKVNFCNDTNQVVGYLTHAFC